MILGIQGPSGSGKTLLFLLIGRIIGDKHFVHLQSPEDWVGNFNGPTTGRIYIFNDEVIHGGNHKEVFTIIYANLSFYLGKSY
jgi:ABC-type glutathione transport system ATPase component